MYFKGIDWWDWIKDSSLFTRIHDSVGFSKWNLRVQTVPHSETINLN